MDNAGSVVPRSQIDTSTLVPTGESDTTQNAPTTTGGETPQSSEAGAEQPQTQKGQPEENKSLILGKFKSQADLEKAYQEAQAQLTKSNMKRSELEKLFTQQPTTEAPQVEQPEQGEEPAQNFDKFRSAIREEITKTLSPTIAKLEVQDMLNKYGDKFVSAAPEVKKIQDAKHISMEDAFKLATYPTVERTSFNQGVQSANKANQQAQKAIVESARPSGYKPASLEDVVASPDVSMSEVAAQYPELNAFAERAKARAKMMPSGKL